MPKRTRSLRTIVGTVTITVTILALVSATAMVLMTSVLHQMTRIHADAIESVHLAENAEVDLLLHARATDPVVRSNLERSLRDRLILARAYVGFAEDRARLDDAIRIIDAYFAAEQAPTATELERVTKHALAFQAIDRMVDANLAASRALQQRASRYDRAAELLGAALAITILAVTGAVLLWLKYRAFRPVLALAATMRRYVDGDRDARATASGAAELQEMAARFNEMASALATQRQTQTAMLGGVAHDLRNPINTLQLAIDSLASRTHDPEARPAIAIAQRQLASLERMVRDFLDLARFEAGRLELVLGDHDLRTLAAAAVETAGSRRIRLATPAQPVAIRCDPVRVGQVISNLMSNALKYSAEDLPIDVEVAASEDGGGLIRVTDQGIGISPEDKPQLFEPFRRLGSSSRAAPGIGLGLYMVRKIVDAHGGSIDVDSAAGDRTTFTVRLPASVQ